jgi:mannose-6-phosphate isomerase-like protein (cupin superfamily)
VVFESQLVSTAHGLVPKGQGWFVLNAREAQWWERSGRGFLCEFEGAGFEGAADFLQLGINLTVLGPGEPIAMYHRENDQEVLVLAGEALAIIEGEERPLRQWGFVHCPPGTNHVLIGAGAEPCLGMSGRLGGAPPPDPRAAGERWLALRPSPPARHRFLMIQFSTTWRSSKPARMMLRYELEGRSGRRSPVSVTTCRHPSLRA